MRIKLPIFIIVLLAMISCKTYWENVGKALVTGIAIIAPDSCDWILIEQTIEQKRSDQLTDWNPYSIFTNECLSSYDSIKFVEYSNDSIDLFLNKVNNDSIIKDSIYERNFRILIYKDSTKIYTLIKDVLKDSTSSTEDYLRVFEVRNKRNNR